MGFMMVHDSFRLGVSKGLLIHSCNLQLGKIVGQGTITMSLVLTMAKTNCIN